MKAFAAALGLALLAAQDQPPRDGKIHAGIGSRFFNQRPAHPAIVLDP